MNSSSLTNNAFNCINNNNNNSNNNNTHTDDNTANIKYNSTDFQNQSLQPPQPPPLPSQSHSQPQILTKSQPEYRPRAFSQSHRGQPIRKKSSFHQQQLQQQLLLLQEQQRKIEEELKKQQFDAEEDEYYFDEKENVDSIINDNDNDANAVNNVNDVVNFGISTAGDSNVQSEQHPQTENKNKCQSSFEKLETPVVKEGNPESKNPEELPQENEEYKKIQVLNLQENQENQKKQRQSKDKLGNPEFKNAGKLQKNEHRVLKPQVNPEKQPQPEDRIKHKVTEKLQKLLNLETVFLVKILASLLDQLI
eukprot:Pgem_evm1s3549